MIVESHNVSLATMNVAQADGLDVKAEVTRASRDRSMPVRRNSISMAAMVGVVMGGGWLS